MAGERDSYDVSAKYYDAAYARLAEKQVLADTPFYVEIARRPGGPVLEIGCGTGRVLLRIAREGIEIEGVDNSAAMLGVLRERLLAESPAVRCRVTLHEADMRSFRLPKKYPLVIIPFRPMQHMYTMEDQLAALRTAAAHLQDGGKLVLDVFFPKFELIPAGVGQEILELEWRVDGHPRRTVRRYLRKESFDKVGQTFTATFLFRTYEGERVVREESEPLKMAYYTYPQMQALFAMAGLEITEQYGSFARARLDNDASEMIFVVRKAS
jgi:ubiquinone/menaquinone biosynthesis C-methylase UbiE